MAKQDAYFEGCLTGAIAAYWTWIFFMFFVVAMQPTQIAFYIPIERACNMGGETALLVVFALAMGRTDRAQRLLLSTPLLAVAAITAPTIALEGCFQLLFSTTTPLASHILCGITSGIGQGILFAQAFSLLAWGECPRRGVVLAIGISVAGAAAGLLCFVPQTIGIPCIALVPPIAASFLWAAKRFATRRTSESSPLNQKATHRDASILRQHLSTVACSMIIFGILFGVGSMVALSSGVSSSLSFLLFLPFFLQGAVLLLLRLPDKCRKDFSAVSSWLMGAAVIALILIPLGSADIRVVALAALILICQLFFLAALIRFLDICSIKEAPRRWLLFGLTSDTFGKALGWVLGIVIALSAEPNESVLIYLIIVLISALVIWKTYMQNREVANAKNLQEQLRKTVEEKTIQRAPWQERVEQVGRQYGLSTREIEVLKELAKGKTAKFIGEKLFISEGTVKSHTYRIYQKLGIHGQQELLIFLEKCT